MTSLNISLLKKAELQDPSLRLLGLISLPKRSVVEVLLLRVSRNLLLRKTGVEVTPSFDLE